MMNQNANAIMDFLENTVSMHTAKITVRGREFVI
jgi:hypothetical protein